jgi:lipopolysaccharide/colanic/teichoic acid biosynthesis glycosyltransferase
MSMLFNNNNNNSNKKPDRVNDLESRPVPQRQDNKGAQPWFVSEDTSKNKNINQSSKETVKRTASILFPIIGLTIFLLVLAGIIIFVAGMYE